MLKNNRTDDNCILTTSEAAKLLGVVTSTVQTWMENGAIDSWKTPGGHRRVRKSHILAIKRNGVERSGKTGLPARPNLADPQFLPEQDPSFPVPENEAYRLAALAATNLASEGLEEQFGRIARLAAMSTQSPIALVSLLTASHQLIKASVGWSVQQIPREAGFCSYTLMEDGLFAVEDAALDSRFCDSPTVLAEPYIRFYSRIALRNRGGFAFGAICVMDHEPRRLRASELQALCDLATIGSHELANRRE